MPNTAVNRTTQTLMTNKSGGSVAYGGVVIVDTTTDSSFTTTTTSGLSTSQVGIVIEPNGIANNAIGMVAVGGWCPRITLNTASTRGQFIKTHTVAGQGTPHSSPQVEGDFAIALEASTSPACNLFGSPNGPLSGGAGTVTHTAGNLTANAMVVGNASADITVLASLGTAGQALKSNGGSAAPSFQGGGVAQVVNTQTGAVATGTTVIPLDDTIPQITEGTEFMTLAITPTSATNKLRIDVTINASGGGSSMWIITALFQDSTANALATVNEFFATATQYAPQTFSYYMTAGTTSATTFRVRIGPASTTTGTVTFNGRSGSRDFGGVLSSSITITEYVT